ncbi:MAG: cytochrome c oxidase assembly protein [Methylobacterium sp.]|jgi:cytochrome c oxidase assembly protein subunit 11|uniref:cytochrome c oxidase assembly protein n=1 Tax=Bosea sp. (in: a-proteobacteria) TaxID=1871050 RepID=UPI000A6CEB90|nr:cytochrome c oxidase assembly protein [Bosea sp. (in: a-proteobacteria)]MBA4269182.1 cytochrome c oxidase assembly protein [Methylobacterium sp.]MBX9875206.1 cytochrome c oxidase assembly protein [Beijerinckiaceae bacterium]MBA4334661.1 cytochrome c oxidase assembly protein [Methylobacterium sp.]MCZ8041436.1 cytochrome c oxidase assembly protein [Beijerinckiaceae bacterium]WRH57946.1 MAG: cytochrome c oxidase assembly protein [Bosea sp. (in: a-proteobacteria)]
MDKPAPAPQRPQNLGRTALICSGVVMAMTGLSFAAVPLYDMFCRATGFGGTPKIGTAAAGTILDRTMSVRFDANVAPGLGWKFEAESPEIKLRVGETKTVFYKITNRTDRPTTGIASYNIAPDKGAAFFVKIQCFCFTEHTLQPGESLEAPVVFYIDPEIADKRELDGLKAITLSYTYFASKSGQPLAQGASAPAKGDAGTSNL